MKHLMQLISRPLTSEQLDASLAAKVAYVAGALSFLIAALPIAGTAFDSGGQEWPIVPRDVPDWVLNALFAGQMLFWGLIGCAAIASGISLRLRKQRQLSIIVAAVICLIVPVGTLLGAYTILLLRTAAARELYANSH